MKWPCILVLAACSSPGKHVDAPSSAWSQGSDLPDEVPRLEPGVTALGQRMVIVGGFDSDLQAGLEITKRVDVYDVGTGTWSKLPDAPVAWTHIQLAGLGTKLYLLGGLAGQTYTAMPDCYVLDTLDTTPTWTPIAPIPTGLERGSAAVVVAPPRIYLLGGAGTNGALATNIFYDVQANTWSQLMPDLPAPRSHPAGMRTVDGRLIVAGGLATLDASMPANDVWSLVPTGTQWEMKMPMPTKRGGCAYGVIQGQLVCAGGEAGQAAQSTVASYDPISDAWATNEDMPHSRAGTQGAAIGDRLFVPGGAEALVFEPTATLYIYAPLDAAAR
ncbi:MAG TPA: kelch repeat-containing protein [Kofleriaceae bacterium]|nr:kelch repeat-containing protein [Kofleriaceae bacterium]